MNSAQKKIRSGQLFIQVELELTDAEIELTLLLQMRWDRSYRLSAAN